MLPTRTFRSLGFLVCWLAIVQCEAIAQSDPALGTWKTTDPVTEVTMVMELYVTEGRMEGRVVRVLNKDRTESDPVCERCSGTLQNQRIVGSTFIRGLKRQGASWVEGRVVDLRPGMTQGFRAWCELDVVDGKLRFLGYKWPWARGWPLLSREVYWDRVSER